MVEYLGDPPGFHSLCHEDLQCSVIADRVTYLAPVELANKILADLREAQVCSGWDFGVCSIERLPLP